MWTRRELKDKAKGALKANYWKAVLVTLVILAIAGGISGYSSLYSAPSALLGNAAVAGTGSIYVDDEDATVSIDGNEIHVSVKDDSRHSGDSYGSHNDNGTHRDEVMVRSFSLPFGPGLALFGITMFLVGLIVTAISVAFYAFIMNPVQVGASRFFLRNLNKPAEVKEIAYAYDNNYLETVKTIFLRDLFVFLWSLLLIVPGIVKAYEYRMIPFLMAEDPTMTRERAFAESKRMMTGQKWNTFVLDLSFIGWYILSGFTLGILAIFYVAPYHCLTSAALYEKLRYGMPEPQPQAYSPYGQPAAQPGQPGAYGQNYGQPAPAAYQPAQPAYQPTQATYQPTQPMSQTAPIEVTPAATADETAPVIVSTSQPPVPPFAAEGAEPAETEAEQAETDVEPAKTGSEQASDEGDSPQE